MPSNSRLPMTYSKGSRAPQTTTNIAHTSVRRTDAYGSVVISGRNSGSKHGHDYYASLYLKRCSVTRHPFCLFRKLLNREFPWINPYLDVINPTKSTARSARVADEVSQTEGSTDPLRGIQVWPQSIRCNNSKTMYMFNYMWILLL